MMQRILVGLMVMAGLVGAVVGPAQAVETDAGALAQRLVEGAGASRGICAILGSGDGSLPLAMVRESGFLVHVLEPDASAVEAARALAEKEGLTIQRIVVEQASFEGLPYADNVADVVVVADPEAAVSALSPTEILRALRPRGTFIVLVADGAALSLKQKEQWVGGADWH